MGVRTKVLAAVSPTSTLTAIYTCPDGETAILKSASLAKLAAGAVSLDLTILRGATSRVVWREQFPIAGTVVYREFWIVMQPADVLRAQTDTGTATLWLSGTELEGVAD